MFQNLAIGFEIPFVFFFKEKVREKLLLLLQRIIRSLDSNKYKSNVCFRKKRTVGKSRGLFSFFFPIKKRENVGLLLQNVS